MISNEIICCPINDRRKRFLFGRSGNSELLVIGLNPSTANESSMDPTSKNIESIASQNGFDGWLHLPMPSYLFSLHQAFLPAHQVQKCTLMQLHH